MQATARRWSVVSASRCARRRLILIVRLIFGDLTDEMCGHAIEHVADCQRVAPLGPFYRRQPVAGCGYLHSLAGCEMAILPSKRTRKPNKSDAGNGSYGVCFHFDIFLLAVA